MTVRLDASLDPTENSRGFLLILVVEDTGIGIAPEDQAHIFEVFVQAGNNSGQKGTGLGLSITQQFVQLMGGTIGVESTPGKGSRFKVELPVEHAEESDVVATNQDRGEVVGLAPGQPAYRILIVEDRKENWMLLQKLLEDAGFQVQVAEDGERGVELFRTWQPDLIWMDMRLPVMGGMEATSKIRLLDGGNRVKIVALTASAFSHEREAILAAGMDDVLRKPFRRGEVFDCITRHLGAQYVYREAPWAHSPEPVAALRPEALARLPETLRKELGDALVLLDAGAIGEVIARVSQQDAQLGEVLNRSAKRLAYSEILSALRNGKEHVREEVP